MKYQWSALQQLHPHLHIYVSHPSTCQGRCGRCPPGSGVMSDLLFSHPLLRCRISNTDDWPDFAELPLVGNIKTNDGSRSIIVSSYNPKDHRDWNSFYAATHERSATTFLFDVQDDGLLLQLVSNTAQAVPLGSCASMLAA